MGKSNVFVVLGVAGMAVTGVIQLVVSLTAGGKHGLDFWFTFYIVWFVFAVLGLAQIGISRRNSRKR